MIGEVSAIFHYLHPIINSVTRVSCGRFINWLNISSNGSLGQLERSLAKYLEFSHDKKRQQQMNYIKPARRIHKTPLSSPLLQRQGFRFMLLSEGRPPRAAVGSPQASAGLLKLFGL